MEIMPIKRRIVLETDGAAIDLVENQCSRLELATIFSVLAEDVKSERPSIKNVPLFVLGAMLRPDSGDARARNPDAPVPDGEGAPADADSAASGEGGS